MAKGDTLIGERVISDVVDKFEAIVTKNKEEIDTAYKQPEFDRKLTIPFQVRFTEPKTGGGVHVRVSTTFATGKVKESTGTVVNEDQKKLPLKGKAGLTSV